MDGFVFQLAAVVFFSPVIILFTLGFWSAIARLLDSALSKLWPGPLPHCSIDPRDHPNFRWSLDGSGWIGNVCAIKPH